MDVLSAGVGFSNIKNDTFISITLETEVSLAAY